jgi:hypothetical protein
MRGSEHIPGTTVQQIPFRLGNEFSSRLLTTQSLIRHSSSLASNNYLNSHPKPSAPAPYRSSRSDSSSTSAPDRSHYTPPEKPQAAPGSHCHRQLPQPAHKTDTSARRLRSALDAARWIRRGQDTCQRARSSGQ